MAASSSPDPAHRGQPPATVLVMIPAHLSFLDAIRATVSAFVWEVGGSSPCGRDLQLAADEAAAVLIEDALAWTEVRLALAHDGTDVYVRIVTRRAQPRRRLAIHELTQLLLGGVVESYEVFTDGQRGYAFLQTPKAGAGMSG